MKKCVLESSHHVTSYTTTGEKLKRIYIHVRHRLKAIYLVTTNSRDVQRAGNIYPIPNYHRGLLVKYAISTSQHLTTTIIRPARQLLPHLFFHKFSMTM